MDAKLTEKQKRFIDYYIETGNASEACRLAGYRSKNYDALGNENKVKLGIYIKEKIKQKEDERIATQDEVLIYLTSVLRGDIEEEKAVVVSQGADMGSTIEKIRTQVKPADRNKAAELLGKRYGIFTDKVESKNVNLNEDISKLSKEEREKRYMELCEKAGLKHNKDK